MAIAGFVAEFSKLMFKFFHGVASAPANVHDASVALRSLHVTLTNLQQSGTKLDPQYKFSTHFCCRLDDCLKELKTFEAKIGKIDAIFGKEGSRQRPSNNRARRSWGRVRWLLLGEQETRRFLEKVSLYHNEFSLELLGLLATINGSTTSSTSWSGLAAKPSTVAEASSGPALAQQLSQPSHFPENPATAAALPNGRLPLTAGIQNLEGTAHCVEISESVGHCGNISEDARLTTPLPYFPSPSIRVTFIHRWSFFLCDLAIRGGPTTALNLSRNHKAQSSAHYRKAGVGLGISLMMLHQCRRKLDMALYVVPDPLPSRTKLTLLWDIDFPRIIPRSAEIVQCAREGSVDGVQRLISAGKATSRDITIHGTTLLHIASSTSNLRLVRLLIQEGGDVNAQDEDGETPLHCAMVREDNYEVARLLIENGADLANNTVDGSTPLHTYFNNTLAKVLMRDDWIEDTFQNFQ
ncbi:MAG: hypothetical protein Q9184_006529, partial [Pyrenodesmia sp. 2 TL-2023]